MSRCNPQRDFYRRRSLGYFDDEVEESAVNIGKPMRHALGNHNDIAFGQMARHTAGRGLAAGFARTGGRGIHDGSAGHKGRRAGDNVEDIRVLCVHLHVTRRDPAAGGNLVTGIRQERQTLGKGGFHLGVVDLHDVGRRRFGGNGKPDKSKREDGKQNSGLHGVSSEAGISETAQCWDRARLAARL